MVEGAAAIGPAAIIENPDRFKGKKVGVVISGGNVETDLLKETLSKI